MTLTIRLDKPCGAGHIADRLTCHNNSLKQPTSKTKGSKLKGLLAEMDGAAKKAAIASAGLLGVSVTAYLATRAKYRAGFKESAKQAEELSKTVKVGAVKPQQHTILFSVGGMAYADESPEVISGERLATTMKMALSRDKGKDFKLVPVSNADSNVPADRKRGNSIDQATDAARIYYDRVAKNGRSQAAVNLAAHVIAYADANPGKQIVMAGHSMGGYDVHEAQEILRIARPNLDKRLKSFAIGSHWLGFTNKFGESHTIGSPNDPETSVFPTRDLKSFKDVKGHSQGAYFASPDVKKFMSDVIYRGVKVEAPAQPEKQDEPKSQKTSKQKVKKDRPQNAGDTPKIDSVEEDYRFDADLPTQLPTASSMTPQNQSQRQFYMMLKIVIERVYQDKVDRIFNCSVDSNDTTTGWFQDGLKVFKFELTPSGLTYAPARSNRGDSTHVLFTLSLLPELKFDSDTYAELDLLHPGAFRTDRVSQPGVRKKHCTSPNAYSCGNTCISGDKVCHLAGQHIAFPKEVKLIANTGRAIGLAQPENSVPPQTPSQAATQAAPQEDPYRDLTIRELRDLAKNRVARYSYMTKEQLKTAIKATEESPDQQERLRKTLEKAKAKREADPFKEYKKLKALSFLWKNKKGTAGVVAAGIAFFELYRGGRDFYKAGGLVYGSLRQRYRGGFPESANTAEARAQGIKVDPVPQDTRNITFTVDGFSYGETENRGRQLEVALKTADPEGFGKKHKIISVTGEEYTNIPGAGGIPQPVRGTVESFQALNRQLFETQIKGRNPQAIELAAQMHAYNRAYNHTSSGVPKPADQHKVISVIGHHEGGNVVDEAMEIYSILDSKAAKNVRVVKLGTPHFGMTDEIAKTHTPKGKNQSSKSTGRTVTITSPKDAFSIFPQMNPLQLNTIKGNSIGDYVSDRRSLDRIKGIVENENFGRRKTPDVRTQPIRQIDPTDPDPRTKPGFGTDVSKRQTEAEELRDWHRRQLRYAKKREEMGRYWEEVETAAKRQSGSGRPKGRPIHRRGVAVTPNRNPENIENIITNPKPKPNKKENSDSIDIRLDSFNLVIGTTNQDDDGTTLFDPKKALQVAIVSICPTIAQVLSIEPDGKGLTGKFIDNRKRLYRYRIKGADISYQEILPPGRTDSIGPDDCKIGTPCKNSCIERGTKCLGTLSEASQAIVKLVQGTIENEQLPSRKELLGVGAKVAGQALRNPVKLIREGFEREQFIKQAIESATGTRLPSKPKIAWKGLKKGSSVMASYLNENPDAVEKVTMVAGLAANTTGSVAGPVGGIAGEVGGVLVARKAMTDYQALQRARKKLKHDAAFQSATKLQKLGLLAKISAQEVRSTDQNEGRSGDIAGAIVGGVAGSVAGPVGGIATGLPSALVAPKVYGKVKEGKSIKTAVPESAKEVASIPGNLISAIKQVDDREKELRRRSSQLIRATKAALGIPLKEEKGSDG